MPLDCSRTAQLAKVVGLARLTEPIAYPLGEGVTSVRDPAARSFWWQTDREIDAAGEISWRLVCGDDSQSLEPLHQVLGGAMNLTNLRNAHSLQGGEQPREFGANALRPCGRREGHYPSAGKLLLDPRGTTVYELPQLQRRRIRSCSYLQGREPVTSTHKIEVVHARTATVVVKQYLHVRQCLLQTRAHPLFFATGSLHTRTMPTTRCHRERFRVGVGTEASPWGRLGAVEGHSTVTNADQFDGSTAGHSVDRQYDPRSETRPAASSATDRAR